MWCKYMYKNCLVFDNFDLKVVDPIFYLNDNYKSLSYYVDYEVSGFFSDSLCTILGDVKAKIE